jgi:hypothetical protein
MVMHAHASPAASTIVRTTMASALWLSALAPLHAQTVTSEAMAESRVQVCGASCAGNTLFQYAERRALSLGDFGAPATGTLHAPGQGTQVLNTASADLAGSTLKVTNIATAGPGVGHLFSASTARLGDRFTVTGAAGGPSRLSADLSGMLWTNGAPTDYVASATIQLLRAGSLDAFARGDFAAMQTLASRSVAWGGADWGSPATLTTPGQVELVFRTPTESFEWMVTLAGIVTLRTPGTEVGIDLGNTLVLHFDTVPGAQVFSASGHLPSATGWTPPPAVPEPASWALLLIGMAGWAARRVRRA